MQANECFVCGCNNFTVTNGVFVCNECGIQSQVSIHNLMVFYFKEKLKCIEYYKSNNLFKIINISN